MSVKPTEYERRRFSALEQTVRSTGPIGADQDFAAGPIVAGERQLDQGIVDQLDAVGDGLRDRISGPLQRCDRLVGASRAVVDEGEERVELESLLVGRPDRFRSPSGRSRGGVEGDRC